MDRLVRTVGKAVLTGMVFMLGSLTAQAVVDTSGLTPIPTSDVSVTRTGLSQNRRTGTIIQTFTLTNLSSAPIPGQLLFVVDSVSPSTATVANADDTTIGGDPLYVLADDLPPSVQIVDPTNGTSLPAPGIATVTGNVTEGALAPGASRTVQVIINAPPRSRVSLGVGVYQNAAGAGTLSVDVNGVAATVGPPNGAGVSPFTAPDVPIALGPNTLTATATDGAGLTGQDSVDVTGESTADTTPPDLQILSPADGDSVLIGLLLPAVQKVRALASDADSGLASVLVNGNPATPVGGDEFEFDLPVVNGNNVITVDATDNAGNTTTSFISIDVTIEDDVTPPDVNIITPIDGRVTSESAVPVAGQVDDDTATVTVNDVDANVSTGGAFLTVTPVPLMEGPNELTATATDLAGNSATSVITVIRDNTPPAISIDTPAPGDTVPLPSVLVTGTVSDANGIDEVTVNGVTANVTGGTFSATVPIVAGSNTITATATDVAVPTANTASASIDIIGEGADVTPPVVGIVSPLDGDIIGAETVAVSGTSDDDTAMIFINGVEADKGSGTFNAPAVPLTDDGPNLLTVTATDPSGNVGSDSITVIRDITPPIINFTSPPDGAEVLVDSVQVTGTVADITDTTLEVNGVGVALDAGGNFTVDVPLSLGMNPVSALATDAAGNSSTSSITITRILPPEALNVEILTPENLTLFASQDPIVVTGTVDDETATVVVNELTATVTPGSPLSTWEVTVPLVEGNQVISAVATNTSGVTGSDTISVDVDTAAPTVVIETPVAGSTLTSLQVDVAGLVNDIITGTTINADDCVVMVNGVQAEVSNRAFVVPNLLLQRGRNTITVEAEDRAGNIGTTSIDVTVQDQAGQRVVMVSGNGQTTEVGSSVRDPLVVTLLDGNGDPVPNSPVNFEVSRGDGILQAFPDEGEMVTVLTDDNGIASSSFTVGFRAGAGNHRVRASAPGFVGEPEFCATATTGPAVRITTVSGNNQVANAGGNLPMPTVVLVTDDGGNPVGGVDVNFDVEEGGGNIDGESGTVRTTNLDGLAGVVPTLGLQQGTNNNVFVASIEGAAAPAVFFASGRLAGNVADTTVSGVVLDNQDNPVPGVTVHLHVAGQTLDPEPTDVTDENGLFSISGAPAGPQFIIADASTTPLPGRWPTLEMFIVAVPGQDNRLEAPIWVLPLSESTVLVPDGGPDEDVTVSIPGIPGSELVIKANSVDCAEGLSECLISWTQVRGERVPMPPPNGSNFMLAWTLQPAGTHFTEPVSICIPNAGEAPGSQTEMYSFDHDLGDFVGIGTATVTEDGSQLCSDPGFGILKSGWGGCAPPPPPQRCTISCNSNNECINKTKQDPPCRCNEQRLSGNSCGDAPGVNSCKEMGQCVNGMCNGMDKPDNSTCDDGLFCTEPDKCMSGACMGEPKPDVELAQISFQLNDLNAMLQKINQFFQIMQINTNIPTIAGSLVFSEKDVCCEAQMGAMTRESSGGGTLSIGAWSPDPFRPTIPPWSGDYTLTIFGSSIGVAYGVEVFGSAGFSAGLTRTIRECQMDVCWGGSIGASASVGAGLFGESPNPAIPAECGANMDRPCNLLRLAANATTGLSVAAGVSCDKASAEFKHNGLAFNAEVSVLEGTFLSFSETLTIPIVQPGTIGKAEVPLPQN